MRTEKATRIWEQVDRVSASLGMSFDQLLDLMTRTAGVCANLATLMDEYGSLTRAELERNINELDDTAQDSVLKGLLEAENYLPVFGQLIIEAGKTFPRSLGGRPQKFGSRESQREACRLVLSFIAKGKSEAIAKKLAAEKLMVDLKTLNEAWKKRAELAALSIEEFLLQLLTPQPQSQSGQEEIPHDELSDG